MNEKTMRQNILNAFAFVFLLVWSMEIFSKTRGQLDDALLHPALSYLVGNWHLTESIESERIPPIKMKTVVADDGRGIVLSLYEKDDKGEWEVILVEYMIHDAKQDKIHVLWSNRGEVGRGVGKYDAENRKLSSIDTNMNGEVTLSVLFEFINEERFLISGFDPKGKKIWAFIYEKA